MILPRGSTVVKGCLPIENVALRQHERATGKLTLRYGKTTKRMNIRYFFTFEQALPKDVASTNLGVGYRITRNETEWIRA